MAAWIEVNGAKIEEKGVDDYSLEER